MKRTLPVKRVSVSAAVEILPLRGVAQLPPTRPAERVSTCKNCQRERTRIRDYKHKQKPARRKLSRANTPIVIQLKDTLKVALRQRYAKLQKQASAEKDDADIETDNSSDPGYTNRDYTNRDYTNDRYSDRPYRDHDHSDRGCRGRGGTDHCHSEFSYRDQGIIDNHCYTGQGYTDHAHKDCSLSEVKQNRHNDKNFSAFLNVMEKAHEKESICVDSNLTSDAPTHEKLVADFVLNNVSNSQTTAKTSSKKSIVECENVEVICNDLNSIESTQDESEESEIASTTSSSDILSDADVCTSQDSGGSQEFTPDELEKLAEFTTGCPLIRYDCSPAECPQCRRCFAAPHIQADTTPHSGYPADKPLHYSASFLPAQKATASAHSPHHPVPSSQRNVSVNDDGQANSEHDTVDTIELTDHHSPSHSSADIETQQLDTGSPLSKAADNCLWSTRPAPQKQLLDIGIAGKQGKCHFDSHNNHYLDSVYIDLTDTDVSFSVYYHHNFLENQPLLTSTLSTTYATRSSSYNIVGPHHHQGQFVPVPMPMYQPYMYWPAYCPPIYNLPAPFCLPAGEAIPKTAMIPPEELPKFSASQPPARHWIPLARPEQGRPAAIFTVMCYNVLCDKYCTQQMYGYCPSWALNWEYRKKGIMDEIKNCSADLICLQEIETDQFYNFFLPELERDGYTGIFSPKSRARTMTEQERKHVDGCAIFYRKSKFRLVKEHLIEFNQLAMANAEGSDEMLNRVMTKDNIGLAALLETQEGVFDSGGGLPPEGHVKQPLLVTTAHVHWDPEFSDVKLIQTMMLMSELKRIGEESYRTYRMNVPTHFTPDCNAIPMILCGDLNSLPESGVIEYLTSGKVAGNHCDFKELGYEACLQTFNCSKDFTQLTHNFHLGRAYLNDSMPHTNYTFDFKGIIDYIFYSKTHMNLLGLLGPLDENWFTENKVAGCPHPHVPSDHFSLFVEFEMPVPYPELGGPAGNREKAAASNALPKLR